MEQRASPARAPASTSCSGHCGQKSSATRLREEEGGPGPVGFVHEFIADDLPEEYRDSEIYIAGPPPMVDAVRRHLVLERGVQIERLHYDRFF